MKLFGQKRNPSTAPSGAGGGGVPSIGGGGRESFLKSGWFRGLLTFCTVLVILAVCVEVYRRATSLGTKVVEAQPVDASIRLVNTPKWLDRQITQKLLDEAYAYASRDEATYNRARDILNNDILRDIADLYTGTDTVDGKPVSRQTKGFNAWIKKVHSVRRVVARDKSSQVIEIAAEYRTAKAWVKAGDTYYLLDGDGTRLPGDYSNADRQRSKMMVVTGVDLPVLGGQARVPLPGERWTAGDGALGSDLAAGMELVQALETQPFAVQIDAIDMTNFNGRKDPLAPWILLDTIWQTADGKPRVIHWGRPIGQEKFYEVQSAAKLRVLNELYLRFNRIDAGRDYVDIRTEFPRLPKLASQIDPPAPTPRG